MSHAKLSQSLPPAFPKMRIGLLGGSFNPAHAGHRHISLEAMKRLRLHQVWWLVTPGNPLKDESILENIDVRAMQARRISAHPRIVVTDFERFLPSRYAAHTLRLLATRYASVQFVWIIGGDNLAEFHRWRQWQMIFGMLPVAVVDRPGCRHKALASNAAYHFSAARVADHSAGALPSAALPAWVYLSAPLRDISSTAIRRASRPRE